MKQEITQTIATSAATLATSTGILTVTLDFLGYYAAGIGAASTITFGAIYVYFQYSSNKKLTIAEINKVHIDDLSQSFSNHVTETREEFKSINTGLDDILSRLPK